MADSNEPNAKTRVRTPKFNQRLLNQEIASYANDITQYMPIWDGHYRLYSKDQLLLSKGGSGFQSLKIYLDLLTDPQVMYCLSKQTNEVTNRQWEIVPTSDSDLDKEVAEFITANLEQIGSQFEEERNGEAIVSSNDGFNAVISGFALALITGHYPGEIVWTRRDDGKIWIKDIKIRDPRRFTFIGDEDGSILPRLVTVENGFIGEALPPRKFIFNRYWSHLSEDPFGAGLGRQLYYPVTWKRQALSFWLNFTDKSTTPVAVGTHPAAAEETEIIEFFRDISNIGQETAFVMPEGWNLKYLENNLNATDAYSKLITYCDKAISLAIMGEATTGEAVGAGSKDNVSNSIRLMKAKGLSDSINETLNNTVIRWLVYFNYGKFVKPPKIVRRFDDLDLTQLMAIVTQVNTIGYKPARAFIQEKFGIPLEPARVQPSGSESPTEPPDINPPEPLPSTESGTDANTSTDEGSDSDVAGPRPADTDFSTDQLIAESNVSQSDNPVGA